MGVRRWSPASSWFSCSVRFFLNSSDRRARSATSAALRFRKTVVMLIGDSDKKGRFVPNEEMIDNLMFSIDVRQASASVEADRVRILQTIEEVASQFNLKLNRGLTGSRAPS